MCTWRNYSTPIMVEMIQAQTKVVSLLMDSLFCLFKISSVSFLHSVSIVFYYGLKGTKVDLKSQLLLGGCNYGSVTLGTQALAYVAFPFHAIMKSSKILAILMVSYVLGSKNQHTKSQYICGVLVTIGIIVFNFSQNLGKLHDEKPTSILGLCLILGSLFCDGILGTRQGEIKKKYNPSAWEQMETINKWAGCFCLIGSLATFQLSGFLGFLIKYPEALTDLVMMAILGTCGQTFIFYTIFNFSPLILSIITTTRKFFTVVTSVLVYKHHMNMYQWISILLVFGGIFVEMLSSSGHGHGGHTSVEPVEAKPIKTESITPNQKESKKEKKRKRD